MAALHLATGQLPDSSGTLFTHPGGDTIVLTHIQIINASANPNQEVTLYVDRGGGALAFFHGVLEEEFTALHWQGQLTLNTGDEITGEATGAASVNYFLDGVTVS